MWLFANRLLPAQCPPCRESFPRISSSNTHLTTKWTTNHTHTRQRSITCQPAASPATIVACTASASVRIAAHTAAGCTAGQPWLPRPCVALGSALHWRAAGPTLPRLAATSCLLNVPASPRWSIPCGLRLELLLQPDAARPTSWLADGVHWPCCCRCCRLCRQRTQWPKRRELLPPVLLLACRS